MIDFILLVAYLAAFIAGVYVGGMHGGMSGVIIAIKAKLREWTN